MTGIDHGPALVASAVGEPGHPVSPSDAEWQRLAHDVKGRVFLPGDAGYRVHSGLFNERYHAKRPAGVVSVANPADVMRSITWARDNKVPVVARSTGHSFAGYSVNDGLVVDLGRLSVVRAEESTGLVFVGGGARVGQMYDAVRPYEMAFPAGNNPLVGLGGLTLGGGAEFASRKFGLTCDALIETTIVTADARLLTCNARENADLFWACRGGGGGNFGINVSFTFQAQPVPDVCTFGLTWKWSDAGAVLAAMQDIVWRAPDEFAARLGVSTDGADSARAKSNASVTSVGQYLGSARELRDLLDPVFTVARPIAQEIVERTFWEAKTNMVHATSGGRFAMRTKYAKEPLSEEGISTMLSWIERWPGSGNADGGGAGLFSWGGEINRTPPAETAFVHRDTLFLVSLDTSWTATEPSDSVDANLRWIDGLDSAMRPYLSESAYQNFIDPNLRNWRQAYYGANYPRLVEIKRKYDPDNLFHFAQSIAS